MKNLATKIICALLLLTMLVSCFAACGEPAPEQNGGTADNGGENNNTEGENNTDEGNGLEGEEGEYLPADANYGNYTFTMRAPKQEVFGTGHYVAAEGKSDVINNALLERSLLLQDMFGFILELDTSQNAGQLLTTMGNNHGAQKHWVDALFIEANHSMTGAQRGNLWNLNLLEEMNLEASYYDQRIQQNFRIGDKLFQLTGDYEVLDELVTFGVLYNDYLYDELGYYDDPNYGSPYKMVSDKKWTYNNMMTMAAPFTAEVAGAQYAEDNKWGIVSEEQAIYYFYMGAGLMPTASKNGQLEVLLNDSTAYATTYQVLTNLIPFGQDPNVFFISEVESVTGNDKAVIASDVFEQDRALFRTTSLSDAIYSAEMEHDFGILPVPLYAEGQAEYYNMINANAAWPLCIPLYVKDVHQTAEMIERLSYYSRYGGDESLYEAFFERLTIAKICRKEEDREMLEMIFSTKVYCIDTYLPVGSTGLYKLVISMANKGGDTLSSDLATKVEYAVKNIGKFTGNVDKFNANQADKYAS
ncbi:MAG: hypothetical protein IJW49_05110 [Clostridia bacterium]|nr:hypothetical protein [Clostridia bacterium]